MLALTSSVPEDHFFSHVHELLARHISAPVLIAAMIDPKSPSGFRVRYQRNTEDMHDQPAIERFLVDEALTSAQPLVFSKLPKLPVGGFMKPTGERTGSVIVAPIRYDEKNHGFIVVESPLDGMFGRRELELVGATADVVALFVRMQSASESARSRTEELRLLMETARALSSERDLRTLFSRFHRLVSGILDAGTFFVCLVAPDQRSLLVPYCVDHYRLIEVANPLPLDKSLAGYVFRHGEPVMLASEQDWERYPNIAYGEGEDVVSALCVPMRIGMRTIGTISVQSARTNAYTERDRDIVTAIAEQAAIAVENSQHLARAELRARELKLLAQVASALSAQFSLRDLCRTVYEEVQRVMDAPAFFVALTSGEAATMHMEYCMVDGKPVDMPDQGLEHSLARRVVETNDYVVLNTREQIKTHQHTEHHPFDDSSVVRSLVMVPLRLGDRCTGIMSAQSYREDAYDDGKARLLLAIGEQLGLAVYTAQLFEKETNRANRDPLTNLYHHRYLKTRLEEEVARAQRTGRPLSILMMDLDNFKNVNDTWGHPVGDEALNMVTAVFQRTCRAADIVGRYGGDEFMMLLPDTDQEQALHTADRIRAAMVGCILRPAHGVEIPLKVSIGVASYPFDATTASTLLTRADDELYRSKRLGRPMAQTHTSGERRLAIEGDFSAVSELVNAMIARDPDARAQIEHASRLARRFAKALRLLDAQAEAVLRASVLHDIGKLAIPTDLLRKPGPLTGDQYEQVMQHARLGAMLVERLPGYESVADAIAHHHERWDGSGKPDGLAGEKIPVLARIVAIIDAFSAMTVDRAYHKAMSERDALDELRRGAGKQFDPRLVFEFARMIERGN